MPDIADKYQLPDYVTKRLRYFDGQFLKDDDFIAEQNYHLDRVQRHDRLLNVSGIVEGLTVEIDPGNTKRVTVSPGTALDSRGRQILLEQTAFVQPTAGMTGTVYLEIAFDEQASDEADNQGVKGFTRFVQAPKLAFHTTKPSSAILLADLTVAADGKIVAIGTNARQYSGVKLPGPAAALGGGTLRSRGDSSPGWAELQAHLNVVGTLSVTENVNVTGNVAIGTTDAAGYKLNVAGSLQATSAVVSGTAQVGTLTFTAPPGDPAPVMTARTIPANQGGSNERTELILFHSNDTSSTSGPDTITLRAPAIRLQTYTDASVGTIDNAKGSNDRLAIDPAGNVSIGGATQVKTLATTETGTAARISARGLEAGTNQYNFILSAGNDTGAKVVHFLNSSTRTADGGKDGYTIRNDGGPLNLGSASQPTSIYGNSIAVKANAVFDGTLAGSSGTLSLGAGADKTGTLSFGRATKWLVTFDSNVNYGSDKAFMLFMDNSGFVKTGTENVRLSIGVFNDFGQSAAHADALDIQGGAQLTLNAGSWDSELETEIGKPGVGSHVQGISFRIHNNEKAKINKDGQLQFPNELGDKIILWDTYGFGINSGNLAAFVPKNARFSVRQNGYNGTEVFNVDFNGNMSLSGNFTPSYVSNWVEKDSGASDMLTFDVGFFPILVSVIAQVRNENGYVKLYTHIPPARHSYDDLDTRGETVYTITGTEVQVRPRGSSAGSNIWNGWRKTRFKVYAWRAV